MPAPLSLTRSSLTPENKAGRGGPAQDAGWTGLPGRRHRAFLPGARCLPAAATPPRDLSSLWGSWLPIWVFFDVTVTLRSWWHLCTFDVTMNSKGLVPGLADEG